MGAEGGGSGAADADCVIKQITAAACCVLLPLGLGFSVFIKNPIKKLVRFTYLIYEVY